jgi:hypothetical protein
LLVARKAKHSSREPKQTAKAGAMWTSRSLSTSCTARSSSGLLMGYAALDESFMDKVLDAAIRGIK